MTLKRIDLTGNLISDIDDGAFSKLTLLEELTLAENRLVKLPTLPTKLTAFNANHNFLKTKGVKANAFKVRPRRLGRSLRLLHICDFIFLFLRRNCLSWPRCTWLTTSWKLFLTSQRLSGSYIYRFGTFNSLFFTQTRRKKDKFIRF